MKRSLQSFSVTFSQHMFISGLTRFFFSGVGKHVIAFGCFQAIAKDKPDN